MPEQNAYRHELKYCISCGDYLALRSRLRAVMQPDPHAGPEGEYQISSVYFDNFRDKALQEKLDGVQKREKFRIRWYDARLSPVHLEKKVKIDSLCLKLSAELAEGEFRALLEGRTGWMRDHPSELVRELRCKMIVQQLRPRVLVSYVREPYVYPPGNVRVTFDRQIRTSLFSRDFLREDLPCICAAPPGERVLEIKYDGFLPEVIAHLVQAEGLRQQAFSKYGACRRYG